MSIQIQTILIWRAACAPGGTQRGKQTAVLGPSAVQMASALAAPARASAVTTPRFDREAGADAAEQVPFHGARRRQQFRHASTQQRHAAGTASEEDRVDAFAI